MVKYFAKPALKELRNKREWTQDEITSLIGADGNYEFKRSYYDHIENARRGIDPDLAVHIARILKTEVAEIFESKNEAPERKTNGN